MINIYILEDHIEEQHLVQELITNITNELATIEKFKLHYFTSSQQLKMHLPSPNIDNVYILDLEINGNTTAGLTLSKVIRQHDNFATIIFLTIHNEFLLTTYKYQVEALDFIEKNETTIKEDLKRDLMWVLKRHQQITHELISLPTNIGVINTPLEDILFLQSMPGNSRQSILHTYNEQQIIKANLKQIEGKAAVFFRTHRSYLVNLRNISVVNVKNRLVYFKDSTEIVPLSRLNSKALIRKLQSNQLQW